MASIHGSARQKAAIAAVTEPVWGDYLTTLGIGTTDLLAAAPAGTRWAAESLPESAIGEGIASGSQYLQDVVNGWGEDLEAGLSEPAKERLLAEFGSQQFWENPASSLLLKATRTTPSMAATIGATLFAPGAVGARIAIAGVSGGLSATQTINDMYGMTDKQSDEDLIKTSPIYKQFRKDGLSEKDARKELNSIMIGYKPFVLGAVGAATSLFGPEAQIARALGEKGLGKAFGGGIATRVGKGVVGGAASEAIETGSEAVAIEQGAVDVGFQPRINLRRVASATAEGATLGGAFGAVGGIRSDRPSPIPTLIPNAPANPASPPVNTTTVANPRPAPINPPGRAGTPNIVPAPGPVSMPAKGSNIQASPPIVPGRVGHTAPTSTATTVPGAKGDKFKKSKQAPVAPASVPLEPGAPSVAPGTLNPSTGLPGAPGGIPNVAAPSADPTGLVMDQTQTAALTKAPPVTPTPVTPTPVTPRTTSQVQRDERVGYGEAARIAEQERAATAPAPPAPAAPAVQAPPGAGFGAGTVTAPVQAVPTGPVRPSTLAPETVEQPIGPTQIPQAAPAPVMEAVPTAPRILSAITPVAPVETIPVPATPLPVPTPVQPKKPRKSTATGKEKDTKRAAKREQDAAIAQGLLDQRPAEAVIPATPEAISEFASELDNILDIARSQDVQFRKKVGYGKTPDSLVWLREAETLAGQLKNPKLKQADKLEHITKFFDREARIRRGEGAGVKAERLAEAEAVKQARTGRAGERADTTKGAATEEQAAAAEEAPSEEAPSEEAAAAPKAVRGVEAPVETREVIQKGGKVKKEEVAKAVTREVSPEARAEIEVRTAAQNVASIKEKVKAKAEEAAKPKPLPPKVAEAKTVAEKKPRIALKVKVTPEAVARAKAVAEAKKVPPKPSGKAALNIEAEKANPAPSPAQQDADNFEKGHVSISGIPVSIEVQKGNERTGQAPSGKRWTATMKNIYAQLPGRIKAILGPHAYPGSKTIQDKPVIVIDQVDADTKAHEQSKVMFGFDDAKSALEAFTDSFSDGRGADRFGDLVVMNHDQFKKWLDVQEGEATGEPISEAEVAVEEAATDEVTERASTERAAPITGRIISAFNARKAKKQLEQRVTWGQQEAEEHENIAAATAVRTGKVSEFLGDSLTYIRDSFLDKITKAIFPRFAKRILELAGDVQVYVIPDEVFEDQMGPASNAAARYNMAGDFIYIKESQASDAVELAGLVLHEATHAAFMKALYSDPKSVIQLNKILMQAVAADDLKGPPHYGLSNIDELVAEAFSNQRFQEFLLGIKADPKLVAELGLDGKYKSLWDVLVRWMGKILGFPKSHDTLFAAVMKVSDRLSLRAPDLQGPASPLAIRNLLKEMDTEDALSLNAERAFRIPEALNRRLPSKVSELLGSTAAPQAEQARTPLMLKLRTMDHIAQLSKDFGENFGKVVRKVANILEQTRVTADKYFRAWSPLIRKMRDTERAYNRTPAGAQHWSNFINLLHDETTFNIFSHLDLASQTKHLGKKTLHGVQPKAKWAELNQVWNSLPDDLKALRAEAMKFYTDRQNDMNLKLLNNILRATGHDDPNLAQRLFDGTETEADIKLLGDRVYDHIQDASDLAKIKGPYYPKMRRGEHVLRGLFKITPPTINTTGGALREIPDEDGIVRTWEFAGKDARKKATAYAASHKHMRAVPTSVWVDTNTGERYFNAGTDQEVRVTSKDADAEQRFRVTVENRYVEFFESKREAREMEASLRADPRMESVEETVPRRFQPHDRQTDMLSSQMKTLASGLERRSGFQALSNQQKNELVQALNEVSLRMLGHTRIQTRRLPRKNILGASRDATANMLEYAQSVSGYLARLDHAPALNQAMKDLREEADGDGSDYAKGKSYARGDITNEIFRRVERSSAFEETGKLSEWVNRSLVLSFLDKLVSPAYNFLNMIQVIMVSYPQLAARHGPGRAAAALFRAYRDIGTFKTLKGGLVASKRALKEGVYADMPSLLEDIKTRVGSQRSAMLSFLENVGSIDGDAGIEVGSLYETKSGVTGGADRALGYLQAFGRQMPRAVETINRTVTALAAYDLEMTRSNDHDAAVQVAQETVNLTQGLYSHTNAAPIFNHPLGRISFQFKKYGQLIYGMLGHNIGRAIRNAEPGDRAEAVKSLAYMTATHVVIAGALGLPTEPLKWLVIGANQAGVTELIWGDVENYEREIMASVFGQQLGEIVSRGITRALPEGFAFDLSTRAGLQDMLTFGEPRSNDAQDVKAYLFELIGGAPVSLGLDWFNGAQALMNGEFGEASEKLVPLKVVADAIKSYRTTSEGKKTRAGYESLAPYGIGEAAIRTLGFTPAREAETSEARNYFYSSTKRVTAERNSLMQNWFQASPNQRGRLWGQIESYNRGRTRDERLTRSELDAYVKRRRTEERSGLVKSGFRVTRREKQSYKKLQGTYNLSP